MDRAVSRGVSGAGGGASIPMLLERAGVCRLPRYGRQLKVNSTPSPSPGDESLLIATPEVGLPMTDPVGWIVHDDRNQMPATVLEGVRGIVSDAVLISEFVREFVERVRDLVPSTVVRESGNPPSPAAAYLTEEFQNPHIQDVLENGWHSRGRPRTGGPSARKRWRCPPWKRDSDGRPRTGGPSARKRWGCRAHGSR